MFRTIQDGDWIGATNATEMRRDLGFCLPIPSSTLIKIVFPNLRKLLISYRPLRSSKVSGLPSSSVAGRDARRTVGPAWESALLAAMFQASESRSRRPPASPRPHTPMAW